MALSSHTTGVAKVAIGSTEIAKISVGEALIWTAVEYSGVGAGVTGTTVPSFNVTAPVGADVFVVAVSDRSAGTVTGITYGGVAMTQIASVDHNSDASRGTTKVFRLAKAGNGSAKSVVTTTGGLAWHAVNAFHWTGVSSVGTPVTTSGSGTALSQSIPGRGMHVFAAGNGGGNVGTIGSFSGVTHRATTGVASVLQALSTTAGAGTAAATLTASAPWSGVFIPIG